RSARRKCLFRAKGATSVKAWGNPGIRIAVRQALKAHFNRTGLSLVLAMHRAFSANIFLRRSPWGAAPGSGVNGAPLALNRYRFTAGAIRRDEQLRKSRGLSRLMRGGGGLTW